MPARLRRSCLVVPASSARMLVKAADLPADEVVVDLEDGVAVADKETARGNLAALRVRGTLAVRINGVRTPWWRDDIATAAHADVIVVLKVESPDEVEAVAELLPADVGLEVQIETARSGRSPRAMTANG